MREQIIEILTEYNPEFTKDLDRDLLATDILDSFDIVKVIVELEDAFDIEIDADDVTPENFQTANAIIALIEAMVENK